MKPDPQAISAARRLLTSTDRVTTGNAPFDAPASATALALFRRPIFSRPRAPVMFRVDYTQAIFHR